MEKPKKNPRGLGGYGLPISYVWVRHQLWIQHRKILEDFYPSKISFFFLSQNSTAMIDFRRNYCVHDRRDEKPSVFLYFPSIDLLASPTSHRSDSIEDYQKFDFKNHHTISISFSLCFSLILRCRSLPPITGWESHAIPSWPAPPTMTSLPTEASLSREKFEKKKNPFLSYYFYSVKQLFFFTFSSRNSSKILFS